MKALFAILSMFAPASAIAVGAWGGGEPPDLGSDLTLRDLVVFGVVGWVIYATGTGKPLATWLMILGSVGGFFVLAYVVGGAIGLALFSVGAAWWCFFKKH